MLGSSGAVFVFLVTVSFFFKMSDVFGDIDDIKFKDKISFSNNGSPHLTRKFSEQGRVMLSVFLTNNFIKEMYTAYNSTELSYLDIINSQITCFQFNNSERLESRFINIAYTVIKNLKTKYRSGRKREQYLQNKHQVAIFERELYNVREISFSLNQFNKVKNVKQLLETYRL